jgi:hypothetical protein
MEQEKINKQKIKHQYNQTYYNKHKEELLTKLCQKSVCECTGKYTAGHKTRHMNSKKHKKFELTRVISD